MDYFTAGPNKQVNLVAGAKTTKNLMVNVTMYFQTLGAASKAYFAHSLKVI